MGGGMRLYAASTRSKGVTPALLAAPCGRECRLSKPPRAVCCWQGWEYDSAQRSYAPPRAPACETLLLRTRIPNVRVSDQSRPQHLRGGGGRERGRVGLWESDIRSP